MVVPSPEPKTSMWALMAYYLRFLRMRRDETGAMVGRILGCDKSKVSRLETGELRLDATDCAKLDAAWETGGLFGYLLHFAQLGHDPNWQQQYTTQESLALIISIYDGQLVPLLLQTEDYMRALLTVGRAGEGMEAVVHTRLRRQAVLTRPNPPEVSAVLDEAVLRRPIGGTAVMRAQLGRLLELAELPSVTIRIVEERVGAYEGVDGPFKVITTATGDVAFVEAPLGGRLITDSAEVLTFRVRYDRMGHIALSRDDSKALIRQVMEAMT